MAERGRATTTGVVALGRQGTFRTPLAITASFPTGK
jgi:hypothetical protein